MWLKTNNFKNNIYFTQSDEHLDRLVEARYAKLRSEFLYDHPIAAVVGPSIDRVTCSYVCMFGKKHKVTNALDAVEKVFKAHFALQLPFAPDVQVVWRILQKAVYKLSNHDDESFPAVNTVVKDFLEASTKK